jgi:hypothetical protein
MDRQKYSLVVLGPSADRYPDLLGGRLRKGFEDLGLDPNEDLEVVSPADADQFDEHQKSPVGLWFGGQDDPGEAHRELLVRLQSVGATVLPLVEDIRRFPDLVPDELKPINGLQWDNEQVPGDVLRAFRLTRELRQTFISYRRTDSRRVAEDLFNELSQRKYTVFLDTASVESAVPFQDALWDRLADMDLLVLLDSPNALTSRWVNDELVQVNNLGLGVLQLIWPGHKPYGETQLSTRMQLAPSDFEGGDFGPAGRLTEEALGRVAVMAEQVRIASLAARRRRVVGEFVALVPAGMRADVQAVGPLVLRPADATEVAPEPIGVVLPVVGIPDAWLLYQEQLGLDRLRLGVRGVDDATIMALVKRGGVRVIYDGLGVRKGRADHIIWLNGHLPLGTLPIDSRPGGAGSPKELVGWLESLSRSDPADGGLA